jgi:hypothetical protein
VEDPVKMPARTVRRQVNPAVHLNRAGKLAIRRATLDRSNLELDVTTALLMFALALEASINYVGRHLFVDLLGEPSVWELFEWLGTKEKIKALGSVCSERFLGGPPFDELDAILTFRHTLAHGRPLSVASSSLDPELFDVDGFLTGTPLELKVAWERRVNLETAQRWRDSVNKMAECLAKAIECQHPLLVGETTDYWVRH